MTPASLGVARIGTRSLIYLPKLLDPSTQLFGEINQGTRASACQVRS
jgi:hypothetical protein